MTRCVPCESIASVDLHAAFLSAYSDYLVRFDVALEQWPTLLARHGVDLALSTALVDADGRILAFALASQRPDGSRFRRLASLGVVVAARRAGHGARLLDDFIARATEDGLGTELEVFAQNEKALRLYESRGLAAVSPLFGYTAEPSKESVCTPETVDVSTAFAYLESLPVASDLPLQVLPKTLRSSSAPLQCWKLGDALLVFAAKDDATVQVACLVDPSPSQQHARLLAQELRHRFAYATCSVPPLQRLDAGGLGLEDAGFERMPLHQLLLRRPYQSTEP
ncbi:hypothetical protein SDRG_07724 [Saprolegnia diclina VS20]|uniref:N-acetyltransferase domain-containing protein n=1 Tax=Saprolegnia diclina (strain VS20) TaxID=1156394 RepID=T0QJN4_SAPDV|nr:hypothetical protein SDRG_07724 [Saprolegnia diclina VS20]EQC34926.1 hypothetical protein SDRG_07724 [Saprolegnia diclina VS20]|eukprot:XP_008611798.1 hypothetical protein SDRG_07724 [Saprolegnia diclina VS20]